MNDMQQLMADRPWVKGKNFDHKKYRYCMTQFVLDHLDVVEGKWVYDTSDFPWAGSLHIEYAAGILGEPITVIGTSHDECGPVPHQGVYFPRAYVS